MGECGIRYPSGRWRIDYFDISSSMNHDVHFYTRDVGTGGNGEGMDA